MVSTLSSSDVAVRYGASGPLVSREVDRTVVWLDGEHDIATVFDLTDTLTRAISVDDADLVIDLSGVTFIGAASIEVLLRGRSFLRQRSRSLTVRSPSRCARRVIDLCGLTDLVESG